MAVRQSGWSFLPPGRDWRSRNGIIQLPADVLALQEIIWRVRPDLVIETGIAHGGSLVLSASALTLLDYADAVEAGGLLDPRRPRRKVLGIDIDIRAHNRKAIETHPMASRIELVEGSSLSGGVMDVVRDHAARAPRVLVCLDSNHTHEHVLQELELYAPLVSPGSYCVVFDTIVEDLPADAFPDRPWKPGNSPKTAVREYLKQLSTSARVDGLGRTVNFRVDRNFESKLMLSAAPEGFLLRD
jgi:cephalosporin hydroxylase